MIGSCKNLNFAWIKKFTATGYTWLFVHERAEVDAGVLARWELEAKIVFLLLCQVKKQAPAQLNNSLDTAVKELNKEEAPQFNRRSGSSFIGEPAIPASSNLLVRYWVVDHDVIHTFSLMEQPVPKGQKRSLRLRSRSSVNTVDDVMKDQPRLFKFKVKVNPFFTSNDTHSRQLHPTKLTSRETIMITKLNKYRK